MPEFSVTRRELLLGGFALGGSVMVGETPAFAAPAVADFTFVHITDMHIQPELGAEKGVRKAFAAVKALPRKPAFALVGGDLVMDAALVPRSRADLVYGMWRDAARELALPLHYSIGNHDLYGLKEADVARAADPDYGKGLWKKRLGLERGYDTFDHQGWRFVTLNSANHARRQLGGRIA